MERKTRYELGEGYRPSNIRPGVIFVRQAIQSRKTITSGSPCCLRAASIQHDDITWSQDHARKTNETEFLYVTRRCGECGGRYNIHYPADVNADRIRALDWKACAF